MAGITVALGQAIELVGYRAAIEAGDRPRHVLLDLADRTGGAAVTGLDAHPGLLDRFIGLLVGGSSDAWVARRALGASDGGYVHANGEAIGFALLLRHGLRRDRSARVGFWIMSPDGVRGRWWLRLIRLLRLRPILAAESAVKGDAIRRRVGRRGRVVVLDAPIDLDFFSPGASGSALTEPVTRPATRPLVASAGLERRDYATLAAAVDGLDVDVVICAMSPDAAPSSTLMPDAVPDTMVFADLPMAGLRDLYRRADVVVVPTVANTIDAGGTVVMEGLACGRPVVAMAQGLFRRLADQGLVRGAEVGSAPALRAAIVDLLGDPVAAAAMGKAGRAEIEAHHDPALWLDQLIAAVRDGGVPVPDSGRRPSGRTGVANPP